MRRLPFENRASYFGKPVDDQYRRLRCTTLGGDYGLFLMG